MDPLISGVGWVCKFRRKKNPLKVRLCGFVSTKVIHRINHQHFGLLCCRNGVFSTSLCHKGSSYIIYPEKKFYSQLTPNPVTLLLLLTPKSNAGSINIYKAYLLFSATAVLKRFGMKRTCCCFNVQSITSKSGLLSSTGPGILQFISIFLHLEYQVETHQPLTGCTVQLQTISEHFTLAL